ncbi:MAG: enoyl-CoA hydratase/isomerase family protein, partial [Desulfobacterales bacterium]
MNYETIVVEKSGVIGKLTFNRPKVMNAYNQTVSAEIIDAVNQFASDDEVRIIVFTGAGKAFMAGADISMVNQWAAMGETLKIRKIL